MPDHDLLIWNVIKGREILVNAILEGGDIPQNYMPSDASLKGHIQRRLSAYTNEELNNILEKIHSTETQKPHTEGARLEIPKRNEGENNYLNFFNLSLQIKNTDGVKMHKYFQTKEGKQDWEAYHQDLERLYAGKVVTGMNIAINYGFLGVFRDWMKGQKEVTILNIGCGKDTLSQRLDQPTRAGNKQTLREWLKEVKGVEKINVKDIDHIASSEGVIEANASELTKQIPALKDSADMIMFSMSLRGTDYKESLKEASLALKKGGRLIISDHKNVFNKEKRNTLIKELERAGFTNVLIEEFHDYFCISGYLPN